jgi:hypothetical protein
MEGGKCESCKNQRIGHTENTLDIKKEEKSLLKYGYSINDTYENRVKALENLMNNDTTKLKFLRHINALRTLQKSNKIILNKLNNDIDYIKNKDIKNITKI